MHVIQCQFIEIFLGKVLVYACYLVNILSSYVIGAKAHLKVWLGKVAPDYDSLGVFGCPAYYHIKEDKFDLIARKGVFVEFNKV